MGTKIVRTLFNRLFGIPHEARVVRISPNSIHYTINETDIVCRVWQTSRHIKKIQIAFLLLLAPISKGFAFLLLTDSTATNNKDAAISQYTPTTNYGSASEVGYVASQTGGDDWRYISHWTLPTGSGTISSVTLNLYQYVSAGTNTGLNLEVHELTQTGWTEGGATWNKYDGSNNWASAGGDFSTTVVHALPHTNGAVNAYRTWQLGTGATNPISGLTWGSSIHLIIRFSNTGNSPVQYENFYTKNAASNLPYIEITYTAGSTTNSNFFALM